MIINGVEYVFLLYKCPHCKKGIDLLEYPNIATDYANLVVNCLECNKEFKVDNVFKES